MSRCTLFFSLIAPSFILEYGHEAFQALFVQNSQFFKYGEPVRGQIFFDFVIFALMATSLAIRLGLADGGLGDDLYIEVLLEQLGYLGNHS